MLWRKCNCFELPRFAYFSDNSMQIDYIFPGSRYMCKLSLFRILSGKYVRLSLLRRFISK